jgi:hypothetical protein
LPIFGVLPLRRQKRWRAGLIIQSIKPISMHGTNGLLPCHEFREKMLDAKIAGW